MRKKTSPQPTEHCKHECWQDCWAASTVPEAPPVPPHGQSWGYMMMSNALFMQLRLMAGSQAGRRGMTKEVHPVDYP